MQAKALMLVRHWLRHLSEERLARLRIFSGLAIPRTRQITCQLSLPRGGLECGEQCRAKPERGRLRARQLTLLGSRYRRSLFRRAAARWPAVGALELADAQGSQRLRGCLWRRKRTAPSATHDPLRVSAGRGMRAAGRLPSPMEGARLARNKAARAAMVAPRTRAAGFGTTRRRQPADLGRPVGSGNEPPR